MLWGKIVEFLLNVPPWAFVYPNEEGVFLRGGKYNRTLSDGFCWKWPIYDNVQKLNVTTQNVNLPNQSITTRDECAMAVSGAIEYHISDVRKAILCVLNFDPSLQNAAMILIAHFLNRKTYEESIKISELETEVLEPLRKKVEDWGLCITEFGITDLAKHKVYRVMSHDTPISLVMQEE